MAIAEIINLPTCAISVDSMSASVNSNVKSTNVPAIGVAVAVAGIVGIAAAALPVAAFGIVFGLIGGGLVLLLPLSSLLIVELFFATVIAGSAEYFLGVSQAHWIPYLMALALGLRALLELSMNPATRGTRCAPLPTRQLPTYALPGIVYLSAIVGSTLIAQPPFIQFFVGAKNYLFMIGVLWAFVAIKDFDAMLRWTWRSLIVVSLIQLPVVLYQRIFIASKLSDAGGRAGLSWDAVSGTFGGGLLGGHSGAMALFAAMIVGYCTVRWLNRQISTGRAAMISILVLVPVFLAEVKAIVIWLLIAGGLALSRQMRSRPLAFFGGSIAIMIVAIAIVFSYKTMYYEGARSVDMTEVYEKQVKYFFDTEKINFETREMGRFASVYFWWNEHRRADISSTLFGHGLGASRGSSSLAVGEVAAKYRFYIDTSAATALLWDVGAFGFAAFFLTLLMAAWEARRLASATALSVENRIAADSAFIGLVLILSGVIYNRDVIDTTAMQFLLFFLLAVVYRLRQVISMPAGR